MKTPSALAKADIRFHPPVKVATERPGRSAAVNSVERASEILLSWGVRSPAWIAAADLCEAASEGRASAGEAREAFRRAAEEAGMLLPDLSTARQPPSWLKTERPLRAQGSLETVELSLSARGAGGPGTRTRS